MTESTQPITDAKRTTHLARMVLVTFIVTFATARILVILIMARMVPDMFLHVGGSHIHHLNYGIFLLSGVGAVLLFSSPKGTQLDLTAIVYGFALALTFDEFGMWVHLGGGYWQRASYDAVVTVAAALGLIAYAPSWGRARWQHKIIALLILGTVIGFGAILAESVHRYGSEHQWRSLQDLEASGPQ